MSEQRKEQQLTTKVIDPIEMELPRAEVTPPTSELDELLNKHLLTPAKRLPPMRFLFKFNDTPCMPICELVADTGKAKSGKTLFMSMIMACALNGKQLALERNDDQPMKVLWFDTEQSEQSTQEILTNRILPMAGITFDLIDTDKLELDDGGHQVAVRKAVYYNADGQQMDFESQFFVVNMRGIGWEMRRDLLPHTIAKYRPTLVILDGTKDLMLDINDATQATQTTEDLMRWAQLYRCCIVNVLHQNKSEADKNMRGSIGTELTNKAFEVFSCELASDKDEEKDTFKVEHYMSRKWKSKKPLYYIVNDNGIPEQCEKPETQLRDEKGRYMSPKPASTVAMVPEVKWESFEQRYLIYHNENGKQWWEWNLRALFTDAMQKRSQRRFNEFMAAAMSLSKIKDRPYFYDRLNEGIAKGIVRKDTAPDTGIQYVVLCDDIPF